MQNILAVQSIKILWTKATRGAPRANERVALPRAFPIQVVPGAYLLQRYAIVEWEQFQPELLSLEAKQAVPRAEDVLSIYGEADGSFRLGILGTPYGGRPIRHHSLKAIGLSQGEFVSLVVNARHSTHHGQYYSETIFNVTCGEEIAVDRFLASQPDRILDLKAHLF